MALAAQPNPDYAATIPHQTFMVYQLMFAIITPALITGAFAERMKFSAMILFTILWSLHRLFPDGAHGLGQGRTAQCPRAAEFRVSISPAAPSCISPRGFRPWSARCIWASASAIPSEAMKPHNLVLSFVGACLLWVGWFGFNAGSALGASGLATSAFVATHFAAATAALGWMLAEWNGRQTQRAGRHFGRGCRTGGHHARLGFRAPMPALLIGFCCRSVLFFHGTSVKRRFGYDDSLDAFGVHGAGGTLGALLTGVFATNAVNNALKDSSGNPRRSG